MEGDMPPSLWWRSLCERRDWVGTRGQRAVMAAKYLVRAASVPLRHHRFLAFLHAHPLSRACVRRDPRLLERHLHRFVNRHWHRGGRLQALHHHYRFLLARLPASLFEAVYVRGRARLGAVVLKDGSRLLLNMKPPIEMGCEGELTIELSELNGRPLYRVVMTVIDEQPTLAIGCIQGPVGADAREQVRELTKQLHGMRPKQLMLWLVYAMAEQWGVRRIVAVGNDAHPLRGRLRFVADYDGFWQEQGGVVTPEGWFALPLAMPLREEVDVPSRHRASFRRRVELRRQLELLLHDAMHPPTGWQPAATAPAPALESSSMLPDMLREASWIS